MKIALCQLSVCEDKKTNISRAYKMLEKAKEDGARIAVLPEMFCIAYSKELFRAAAEEIPGGEAYNMLAAAAKELSMSIVGGSVPEKTETGIYNTCTCFNKEGKLVNIYRKAHLFDVDFEGLHFRESDTISRGNEVPKVVDDGIKYAVSICFDIRFPEFARIAMKGGADLLCLPAAFAQKTGRKHWELLIRARALDNQMFIAAVAPASCKFSYGHSMLCAPTGEVLCDLGTVEGMQTIELPQELLYEMRQSIPIKNAIRNDLY